MSATEEEKKEKERLELELSEKAETDRLKKNPPLELLQCRYMLTCEHASDAEKEEAKTTLMGVVKEQKMAPFYAFLCDEYKWTKDVGFAAELRKANEEELVKLDAAIKDAEENFGETEIREANLAKAEYLCMIGSKDEAVTQFRITSEKTVSVGQRLDIVLNLIRLGMFYGDTSLTARNLDKADALMEEGGDWDRRNRLKVYRAVYATSMRDFKKATELFLDTVSTFTSYEIMTYGRFVDLTVITGVYALSRNDLKDKVVKGPEIQEMLHQSPTVKTFLESITNCDYVKFFQALAEIESMMTKDVLLAPHRKHYVREMRILAYSQLLESYRSVTLDSMAKSFGVSVDFIDREVARFVAAGRLNCKIDKVGGIIETNRPDSKNAQYRDSITQGDILLNRLQKLSQVIKI